VRHVPLDTLLAQVFADEEGKRVRKRLRRAHKKLVGMPPAKRKAHTDRNGPNKWKPIKDRLTRLLGKKCWYTEVELIGAPLAIDHYRPICNYWWLSFDAENYRVACPWANSPEHNAEHGCAGGKGDNFPLLPPGLPARGKCRLRIERPAILDPCKSSDCDLLAFQADGRPIVSPNFAADAFARQRVEQSTILLNLDHPEFNSKREQLCGDIGTDIRAHEALPANSAERAAIRTRLQGRLAANAPFSTAARFYLKLHRHLDWVEDILRLA
jgi:hypothetical protein